ncbi:NACHT domain-containing protein [Nonomuraea helvata]|uniref:NACHT domain-containing protein n=1 Tax=Nonomuraea helvata TaxID=37484 RepID=A0ABV5RQC2_9ACTN
MARGYRYVDAVRLLGGEDPAVKALDILLGVGTLGVWDLIEAKNELVKVGNGLLGRWRDWRADKVWRSRTERLEAAHAILVVTAYLEALGRFELPDSFRSFSKDEQRAVFGMPDIPCPAPHRPFEQNVEEIAAAYRAFNGNMIGFLEGLELRLEGHEWKAVAAAFRGDELVEEARRRYTDRFRQLALDVPEFAFWAGQIDHQATRAGLSGLARLLATVASGGALPDQLDTISRLHLVALTRPVAETGDVPAGMELPTLDLAYQTPHYRVAEVKRQDDPSTEPWWAGKEVREDLAGFLAGFLTGSGATERPLVVLGQPGAGKSVLTKVLAARLSQEAFLPIRVPLREVSAGADLQQQIEQAIYRLSGERLQWPEVARAADGVLPVVFLDGFDELLQATGVRQTDYLEKVARFQQRERDAGRAVAVIVTSRTAVANRADFPEGTSVAKLEPFDGNQIARWLEVWNTANAGYFRWQKLRPLTLDVVSRQAALAEQPLLLLMLALYDADGNALHSAAELGEAELYERLMRRFVERELKKAHPPAEVGRLVERELVHLACVAFSMFNRGRQWATSAEFDEDLKALRLDRPRVEAGFATPLSSGDLAPGKFFFVHEDRATRDDEVLQTYEFLHATFGEYLIARFVASLLGEILAQEAHSVMGDVDDGRLRTLLSWATLSTRAPVISFLRDLAKPEWRPLIVRLFRGLDTREEPSYPYRPWTAGPQRRYAYYSANLVLLALVCGGKLRASELMPGYESTIREWRGYALLWRSQCAPEEWSSILDAIAVKPEMADMVLSARDDTEARSLSGLPDPFLDSRTILGVAIEAVFCYDTDQMALFQAITPFLGIMEAAGPSRGVGAPIRGLLEVLALQHDSHDRGEAYTRAIAECDRGEFTPLIKAILGDLVLTTDVDRDEIMASVSRTSQEARDVMLSVATALALLDRR